MPKENARPAKATRSTGINFESTVLEYLDDLRRDSPLFRRRSRSEVVNMIIEEFAATNGTPIQETEDEKAQASA